MTDYRELHYLEDGRVYTRSYVDQPGRMSNPFPSWAMTDDFEDPPNDIPDEPPAGPPTAHPDDEFPDDDAIDGTEEDATTIPEDPQT